MKKVRWYKIEVNVVLNFIGIRCFNNKVTSWTIILYIGNLKNRLKKGFQWYTNTYANFWLQCSSVLNCAPLTCLQYWFRDQGWDTIYTIHVSWTIHSNTTNHRIVVLEKILKDFSLRSWFMNPFWCFSIGPGHGLQRNITNCSFKEDHFLYIYFLNFEPLLKLQYLSRGLDKNTLESTLVYMRVSVLSLILSLRPIFW